MKKGGHAGGDEKKSPEKRSLGVEEEVSSNASNASIIGMMQEIAKMMQSRGGSGGGVESRKDGEHSNTPGPAPCGRKHWFEGKEVDFVTKYGGRLYLGFNIDDNPLLVARNFVAKHNLNPQSTDNTQLITKIADMIRETQLNKGDENNKGGEMPDLDDLIEGSAKKASPFVDDSDVPTVIRPEGVHARFNHVTKQVEVIHYPTGKDYDDVMRKKKEEEDRRKAAQQKAQERETERSRKEQELREMREKIAAQRRDAQVSYVPQPKVSSVTTSGTGVGMATLSSLGKEEREERDGPGPKSKWDEMYWMKRLKKIGSSRLMQELDDAGFVEEEKAMMLLRLQARLMYDSEDQRGGGDGGDDDDDDDDTFPSATRKERKKSAHVEVFAGEGHSLGSSSRRVNEDETSANPNNNADHDNGDNGGDDDRAQEIVVDNSLPTTQIRFSIPDRQQAVVVVCNTSHTVLDLRRHVNATCQLQTRHYHMQLLRPPTKLENDKTVQQANLQKATINIVFYNK